MVEGDKFAGKYLPGIDPLEWREFYSKEDFFFPTYRKVAR